LPSRSNFSPFHSETRNDIPSFCASFVSGSKQLTNRRCFWYKYVSLLVRILPGLVNRPEYLAVKEPRGAVPLRTRNNAPSFFASLVSGTKQLTDRRCFWYKYASVLVQILPGLVNRPEYLAVKEPRGAVPFRDAERRPVLLLLARRLRTHPNKIKPTKHSIFCSRDASPTLSLSHWNWSRRRPNVGISGGKETTPMRRSTLRRERRFRPSSSGSSSAHKPKKHQTNQPQGVATKVKHTTLASSICTGNGEVAARMSEYRVVM
jgi:hypothetical protein